jgi:peptide deformylase
VAILPIRTFGDPALRQRAQEVPEVTELHKRLAADMIETMRAAPGVGLAGPQVGILERIFVWEVGEEHGVMINPAIVARGADKVLEEEGCLSLPGLLYEVERELEVTVEGLDGEGLPVSIKGQDLLARIFQHEIDHLDGVLFIDRIEEAPRKEALRILRDQALGLTPAPARKVPEEDRL